MVNSGAIATTSLVPGGSVEEKWDFIRDGVSRFAGRELSLDEEVYESASQTNDRNQSIARLLRTSTASTALPPKRSSSTRDGARLSVTARELAVMGATLADGGMHPVTRERVVDADTCRYTLAVMTTAGLYETSGEWPTTSACRARAASAAGS